MPLDDLSGFRSREEAEQKLHLYQELYDEYSRQEQPDQVFLADTVQKQASALYFLGRYKESLPLLEQSLTMYESHLGLNHQKAVIGLINLAVLHSAQGEFETARTFYEQGLTIWKTTLGEDHPYTVVLMRNYATLLRELGRVEEAKVLEEKVASTQ